MTKKMIKIMAVALSAVMLVVGSIMGTVAYLTDTDEVSNTFTYGDIVLTMDEAKIADDGVTADTSVRVKTGNEYKLIPGKEYKKDTKIHIGAGSEACYLFVQIDSGLMTIAPGIATALTDGGWQKVMDNVYYKLLDATVVAEDITVIDTFTVSANQTNQTLAGITSATITAYAVQREGVDNVAVAWTIASQISA